MIMYFIIFIFIMLYVIMNHSLIKHQPIRYNYNIHRSYMWNHLRRKYRKTRVKSRHGTVPAVAGGIAISPYHMGYVIYVISHISYSTAISQSDSRFAPFFLYTKTLSRDLLVDEIPVHKLVKERVNVSCSHVLVVEVVCMLPHIHSE